MTPAASHLTPPRIIPPSRPLGRLAFAAAFVRNPLEVIPQAAYEEDFVPLGGEGASRICVTSPALIKAVLLDERDKFQKITQIRLLRPLLGRGILTSEGAEWKWQRQASAPMFRPQDLAAFVPTFVRIARELVESWRAAPQGSTRRIDVEKQRSDFDVIRRRSSLSATVHFRAPAGFDVIAEISAAGTNFFVVDERSRCGCRPGIFAARRESRRCAAGRG